MTLVNTFFKKSASYLVLVTCEFGSSKTDSDHLLFGENNPKEVF